MEDLINVEAFELDKGVYYIELQNGTYEIDGKRVQIGWNDNKVIVDLDNKPEIFKIDNISRIDHYLNSNGEILIVESYNKKYNELNKDENFSSLEDEYTFKKFIQEWKAVYIEYEEKHPVEYSIKYNVYNLPKYITPMRKITVN